MRIDHERLLNWTEYHFDDITVSGYEIKVNDPWWTTDEGLPDNNQKCWLNTSKGCYHAFKSERHGSIIEFVMLFEGCDWDMALDLVAEDGDNLRTFDEDMAKFLEGAEEVEAVSKPTMRLPSGAILIDSMPANQQRKWALNYLGKRKLSTERLLYCMSGKYKDRIVIPYYGKNGDLIYFNTRTMSDKDKLRYLGPDNEEFGIGKSDVLWMHIWPETGSKIYLTEGEFDAMSLVQCGLSAAACGGKVLSSIQTLMLSSYRITLAFDADKAGSEIYEISQALQQNRPLFTDGKRTVSYVRPPIEYKDWNKFLIEHKASVVKTYIKKYERACNEHTLDSLQFEQIATESTLRQS